MQLLKLSDTVNFMRLRIPAMVLSTVLILGSFVSLGVNSLNWGLDFTGGTLIEVGYEEAANLEGIRAQLNEANFEDAIVQNFGSSQDVLIRIAPRDGVKAVTIGEQVLAALRADGTEVDMRRIEFVGPNVGEEPRLVAVDDESRVPEQPREQRMARNDVLAGTRPVVHPHGSALRLQRPVAPLRVARGLVLRPSDRLQLRVLWHPILLHLIHHLHQRRLIVVAQPHLLGIHAIQEGCHELRHEWVDTLLVNHERPVERHLGIHNRQRCGPRLELRAILPGGRHVLVVNRGQRRPLLGVH